MHDYYTGKEEVFTLEGWGSLYHADCRAILPALESDSIDSMVTDPPAGIEFMGKDWDNALKFGETFAAHGFSDGGDRIPAPAQKLSERNPVCLACHKHARGSDRCRCDVPNLDESPDLILERRLQQRQGFVSFMETVMRESFRVLKPGAHAVVWALPRTSHWTATALENVGFEIRDCIYHVKPRSPEVMAFLESLSPEQWELLQRCSPTDEFLLHVFGSGFPKSHDISKALDKMAGAVREVVGEKVSPDGQSYAARHGAFSGRHGGRLGGGVSGTPVTRVSELLTAPTTDDAKLWAGWGTALKPAVEVWWVARKPIREVNVATQVRKTGTGAMNIDGCRVKHANAADFEKHKTQVDRIKAEGGSWEGSWKNSSDLSGASDVTTAGRWPSHILLSHAPGCRKAGTRDVKTGTAYEPEAKVMSRSVYGSTNTLGRECGYANEDGTETVDAWECEDGCPVQMLNSQSGETSSGAMKHEVGAYEGESVTGFVRGRSGPSNQHGDTGGASRFFQTFEHEEWACAPECPVRQLDEQSGELTSGMMAAGQPRVASLEAGGYHGGWRGSASERGTYGDSGGASRFFETFEHEPPFVYVAKASRSERDEGLPDDPKARRAVQYGGKKQRQCNVCGSRSGPSKEGQSWPTCGHEDWQWVEQLDEGHKGGNAKNTHPTVKPIKLMRYLVRLVTPKGGTVLDPFSGSGSTLLAALLEGAKFLGIEREAEYMQIAEGRLRHYAKTELGRKQEEAVFDLLAELEQEF